MWKEELAKNLDRKRAEITFDLHLFDRKGYWNIDLDKVEETVRTGKIFEEKCEQPNKLFALKGILAKKMLLTQ